MFDRAARARTPLLFSLALLFAGCRSSPNSKIPSLNVQRAPQISTGQPEPDHFYATAKPYTRWWWFASEIQKEDIIRQLDWLKERNFGGVEIAWVYPLNIERYKRFYTWITDEERKAVAPRQKWQSPE